ncbi:MAG: ESPR-type extended signal peptide-containing protein [Neisseria sp.]|nr:ESPR-type extended signal peptide-containing protein [Neisseria sp.]
MNQIFKVVFNVATGTWTVVSEMAKAQGKTKSAKVATVAAAVAAVLGSGVASAANVIATGTPAYLETHKDANGGSVLIGESAMQTAATLANNTVIGRNANVAANGTIAIGAGAATTFDNTTSIGTAAASNTAASIAIGHLANTQNWIKQGTAMAANATHNLAIGENATIKGNNSVAINAGLVEGGDHIVIGHSSVTAPANLTNIANISAKQGNILIGNQITEDAGLGAVLLGHGVTGGSKSYDAAAATYGEVFTTAVGAKSEAYTHSTAIGSGAVADPFNSTTFGWREGATAVGSYARVTNSDYATVLGSNALIHNAQGSSVVGNSATAFPGARYSSVMGANATARSFTSVALGSNASAGGWAGTGVMTLLITDNFAGNTAFTQARTNSSVAIGNSTLSLSNNSVALGNQARAGGTLSADAALLNTVKTDLETAINAQTEAIKTSKATYLATPNVNSLYSLNKAEQRLNMLQSALTAINRDIANLAADGTVAPENAIAIGNVSLANHLNATAIGAGARATGNASIAIGTSSRAQSNGTIAMGRKAIAIGNGSTAIGENTSVSGHFSTAVGYSNFVDGQITGAFGYRNFVSGSSYAIGSDNHVLGENSYAVGSQNVILSNGSFVFGSNVDVGVELDGSVVLGRNSKTSGSHTIETVTSAIINGVNYGGFVGVAKGDFDNNNGKFVSIGAAGDERKIINVAAGNISASSTEAINGSQLYIVTNNITTTNTITPNVDGSVTAGADKAGTPNLVNTTTVASAINGAGWRVYENSIVNLKDVVTAGNQVVFADGNNTTANVTIVDNVTTVKYDVSLPSIATEDLTNTASGTISTPKIASALATVGTVASAVNDSFWNVQASGAAVNDGKVNPGNTLNFIGKNGVTVTANGTSTSDNYILDIGVAVDGTTIKVNDAGQLTAVQTADTNTVTSLANGTTTTVNNAGTTDAPVYTVEVNKTGFSTAGTAQSNAVTVDATGKAVAPTINANGTFLTADAVVNLVNAVSHNVTISSTKDEFADQVGKENASVGAGDTLTLQSGKNLIAKQDGKTITFATANDVSFTSVNANGSITVQPTIAGYDAITIANNTITGLNAALPTASQFKTVVDDNGATATSQSIDPTSINVTQAATLGDVLNAGWNLQNNGAAKDFVTPYNTVNFVNGTGTVANVVTTNGEVSNVTFNVNVDGTTIKVGTDGKLYAVNTGGNGTPTVLNNGTTTSVTNTGTADAPVYTVEVNKAGFSTAGTAQSDAVTVDATGKAVAPTANADSTFLTAGDAVKLVNAVSHNVTIGSDTTEFADQKGKENASVGAGDTLTLQSGKNLIAKQEGTTITFATANNVTFTNVDATDVNATTVNATAVNAGAVAATTSISVVNGPSMSTTGIDAGGKQITNVAAGVADTDAVNVSQLKALGTNISNRLDDMEDEQNAGTASALAVAGLMQAYREGQSVVTAGVGHHKGQSGLAVGFSSLSDNGKVGVKFAIGANTKKAVSGSASVGYFWQ